MPSKHIPLSKHISPSANTSNPLCNCPHALKTHFTQCQHLKPPLQLPPCPQNTFHPVPTSQTTFATAPMPSKHISPIPNISNPLFNCLHALKTHFTQCQYLKPSFQLPPCPQNTFHPLPSSQTTFATAPMPSKHISPSANTSNPLFNCLHALKTHFIQCQYLKPPFQLPPCPQNTFHPFPTSQTPFSPASMPSKHIPPSANTSNPLLNCRLPSKHISPSANTSNPLCNCPHALETHFTQCQHLKPPLQLPPSPQNTFLPFPTPQTPYSPAPMPSKHISPSANTSNPLFNCPHALKTHFTQCQHLKPHFQLPPCPQNTFHPVPTPQTPFAIAPMPSKHIPPSANTSNPLCNCPHALKTHFTQCQHLKPPLQLPPCPQNTFHPVPTPHTPFSSTPMPSKHIPPSANTSNPFATAPMPSKHISPTANISNPLGNCPRALKTQFTHFQHLKPPFQLPPCPQNTFHPVPTRETPFATAPMPSKHISPSANTSNPLCNCPHALKTLFTQCQHLKPPFHLPPCPQNTFHAVPTPQTPFATAPMPSQHVSPIANTSNPLWNCPHALKTHFTQCQHLKPPFQLPPCPQNTFHPLPTPHTPFSTAPMPSKHISPSANTSNPLCNCPHALTTRFTHC